MEWISDRRKERIEKEIEKLIRCRDTLEKFSEKGNERVNELLREVLLEEEIGYITDWIDFYTEKKKRLPEQKEQKAESTETTKQTEEAAKPRISFSLNKPNIPFNFSKLVIPIIMLLLVIAGIFLIKPTITGYVTITKETSYNQTIDRAFAAYTEYPWVLEHAGNLRSIKLSGIVSRDGYASVYLVHDNVKYVIFDSSKLREGGLIDITGLAVSNKPIDEPIIKNESLINKSTENEPINKSIINESINKTIKIHLEYASGIAYDEDNDGVEPITGVIDLTAENSKFSWNADYNKLCTKWETYSADNNEVTTVCYGSDRCCALGGLEPTAAEWDDAFYLNYGKYGADLNNMVSAQIIYTDYNLSIDNPYAEVYYSEWQSLNATFYKEELEFSNICVDSCLLEGFNEASYILVINASNATITISTISYSILGEIQKLQLQLNVEDSTGQAEANLSVYKDGILINETIIEPGLYDVEVVPGEKVIEKIRFEDVNITGSAIKIGVDNVTKGISLENVDIKKKFAIDTSRIGFNNATFTSTATASSLYKCKEWDFKAETCYGAWVKIKSLVIGREYNLTLTQADPGFAEGDLILPARAKLNITPKLKPDKKDFKPDENASFEFEFVTEKELIRHNKPPEKSIKPKQTKRWATDTETIETFVYDSSGKSAAVEPEIEELREGRFKVNLPKQRQFKAGKYALKVELIKDGVSYTQEQNFTWGVLAINTHKSIYLENENAFVGIGVLNDEGRMVCNASVALEITDPLNQKTTLTTADGGIKELS